jgi:hypothetical protein
MTAEGTVNVILGLIECGEIELIFSSNLTNKLNIELCIKQMMFVISYKLYGED